MGPGPEIRPGKWSRSLDVERISDPRVAAIWVVERCLHRKLPADDLRARFESTFDARDRALLHRLTIETLRWLRRIDDVLEQVGGRPIGRIDARLLGPLRLGAAQLLFLDRVPPHAAVSTAVDLAAKRTRAGARFVNALLRKVAASAGLTAFPVDVEDPIERLAIETSHRRSTVQSWVERFGAERARRALEANNRDRPASLLVLGGGLERDRMVDRIGASARASTLSPIGLLVDAETGALEALIESGALHPQDEASQCAALVPPPRAGERVLDAAASPGGKSLALLSWEPRARVVAADEALDRLDRLAGNARRTGAGYRTIASDARRPALSGGFDRVLADLPCTGSGTFRKHPELKWRMNREEIERLVASGAMMLDGLVPLVAPGGLLVVATCSVETEENEDQVAALLERHADLDLVELDDRLPTSLRGGVEATGRWRLLPGADHDGFTVHLLRRRAAS